MSHVGDWQCYYHVVKSAGDFSSPQSSTLPSKLAVTEHPSETKDWMGREAALFLNPALWLRCEVALFGFIRSSPPDCSSNLPGLNQMQI